MNRNNSPRSTSYPIVQQTDGAPERAPLLSAAEPTVERALVRVAIPLNEQERRDLEELLQRCFRRPLQLDLELDPTILGGVWVRVGDTVIDGSLRGRLEALRRHLSIQSRIIVAQAEKPGTLPKERSV